MRRAFRSLFFTLALALLGGAFAVCIAGILYGLWVFLIQ